MSVVIRAVREWTVWENKENGYGIYHCKTEKKDQIVAVGYDIPAAGSCWLNMTGDWKEHPKYGKQFEVSFCEVEKATTKKGVVDYFKFLKIGMGKARAEAAYQRFGEHIWNVLDHSPERLREVNRIPESVIEKFCEHQKETQIVRQLMQSFSMAPEFTTKLANKIAKELKGEAVSIVSANPYALCKYANLGFPFVDRLVNRMGTIPETFPARFDCAIFYLLNRAAQSGHTCLPEEVLVKQLLALLNGQGRKPISRKDIDANIQRMLKKEILYNEYGMLFSSYSYQEEYLLAKGLTRLLQAPVKDAAYAQSMVEEALEQYMENNDIQFAPDQKKAIISAFLYPVSVVTGGPGTGKTTLTKAILEMDRYIHRNNSKPLLLAPTGRAAKRLGEATGRPARTIHSAIGYHGEKNIPGEMSTDDSRLDRFNLIIVDESSMLDQMIASWFIQLVPDGTRVVFVGDADQLPSVGAGNVLYEMIESHIIPVIRLHVIFRQKGTSLIVSNAAKIHDGSHDLEFSRQFRAFDRAKEEEQIAKAVTFYKRCVDCYGMDQVMMLCPYRNPKKTNVNTTYLNYQIQRQINPFPQYDEKEGTPVEDEQSMIKSGKVGFRVKDRVMQLKNVDDVLNGDIGVVTEVFLEQDKDEPTQFKKKLAVDFGLGVTRTYDKDMLGELDLAYCNTVHKSQGSEYQNVILILSNAHEALLQRNLVYTAITRATENVALIGDIEGPDSALVKAIDNTNSCKRYTKLGVRLQDMWQSICSKQKKVG